MVFDRARSQLDTRILALCRSFAEELGIEHFDEEALHRQISVPISQMTAEILWFGMNIWPVTAELEADEALNDNLPAAVILPRIPQLTD